MDGSRRGSRRPICGPRVSCCSSLWSERADSSGRRPDPPAAATMFLHSKPSCPSAARSGWCTEARRRGTCRGARCVRRAAHAPGLRHDRHYREVTSGFTYGGGVIDGLMRLSSID
jgi:hypothetical protein